MKKYRALGVALLAGLLTLPLVSCRTDNDEESGTVLRIVSVEPVDSARTPDAFISECSRTVDTTTTPHTVTIVYESGLTNQYVTITIKNESRPNTATGSSTNSHVELTEYQIDYIGLNLDPVYGTQTVGIAPDASASMVVTVLPLDRITQIQSRYRSVENNPVTLRAQITIWGNDGFGKKVKIPGKDCSFTMVVTDYDRCTTS